LNKVAKNGYWKAASICCCSTAKRPDCEQPRWTSAIYRCWCWSSNVDARTQDHRLKRKLTNQRTFSPPAVATRSKRTHDVFPHQLSDHLAEAFLQLRKISSASICAKPK